MGAAKLSNCYTQLSVHINLLCYHKTWLLAVYSLTLLKLSVKRKEGATVRV